MRTSKKLLFIILSLALVGASAHVRAEQKSLKALITWDGQGRVFLIGTDTMQFLGAFEGIMYIETAEGKLDEGFVECPASQTLDLKSGATSGSGHCMITASGGDTVYAEWTCAGKVGGCKGDFKLTGGSGKFEGITGSSKLLVRSPLRVLAKDMASGSVLRAASGIAILPQLNYKIPSNE